MLRDKHIFQTIKLAVLLLAVLSLHSCRKHRKSDDQDAIMLGIVETRTRAAVENVFDLKAQSCNDGIGFGVFGYKKAPVAGTNNFSHTLLFNNTEVFATVVNADTTWTYQPTRYWDSNPQASYQFLAYWPHLNLGSASVDNPSYVTESNKSVIFHDIPNWQYGDDANDYMYATRFGRYVDDFKPYQGRVRFTFRHMLSRLVIRGYYVGNRQDTITVTGYELEKSAGSNVLVDGTTDFSLDFSEYGNDLVQGANSNTPDYGSSYSMLPANTVMTLSKASFAEENSNVPIDTAIIGSWLLVPHEWQDINLKITYKVGRNNEKASNPVSLTLGKQSDSYKILAGNKYVLTLKFNSAAQGVIIESVAINDWIEEEQVWGKYNW